MAQILIAVSPEELTELVRKAVRDELRSAVVKPTKAWLTVTELAEHFQVCGRTVVNWTREKGCPHFMVGDRRRFELAAVERWHAARIDGRTVPDPPAPNPHSRRVEV